MSEKSKQFLVNLQHAVNEKEQEIAVSGPVHTKLTEKIRDLFVFRSLNKAYFLTGGNQTLIKLRLPTQDFLNWVDGEGETDITLDRHQSFFRFETIFDYKTNELAATIVALAADYYFVLIYDEERKIEDIIKLFYEYEYSEESNDPGV